MRYTIAETYEFYRLARQLLRAEELEALINYCSGTRIIYYYHNESVPIYLLTIFGKGEKTNLTKQECNELAKIVHLIKKQISMGILK